MKGKHEQAREIIYQLHSTPGDPDHVYAEAECIQITRQAEVDKSLKTSLIGMWRSGRPMQKRMLFAVLWPFITTASGILVIASKTTPLSISRTDVKLTKSSDYGPLLYAGLGYDAPTQLKYDALWMTIQWFANIVAPFVVDRFPRPGYVAFGLSGCFLTLVGETIVVKNYAQPGIPNTAALKAGVAMLFMYAFFYGVFIDGMLFIWIAEVFPTPLRARGFQLGLTVHALSNIVWLGVAPTAFA